MRLKRTSAPDLTEIKPGIYTTKSIELPHGDRLLFEGFIPKCKNEEARFFTRFLKDNSIYDLVEEAQDWDGCWAIVHTNGVTTRCFTDPLGKKQLYYNSRGEIASTIAPLITDDDEPDFLYLGSIHKWGYNVDDRTPFKKIKRVMPGRLYTFVGSTLQNLAPEPYYNFNWGSVRLNEKAFRMLVSRCVEDYTTGLAKVPSIGILLSGGIDSSIISFELLQLKESGRALKNTKLNFYTINNKEDEPYVKLFARKFHIPVTTIKYDMNSINLEEALRINETPVDLGSMVPNQIMFKVIPDRVIFTGDGPDELFGGYRRIDEYDSQKSDVFHELSFYHLPRLEKAASALGKELRCPWLSYDIVRYALSLPFEERKHKSCMKEAYRGLIPDEIIDRPKLPLKNDELRADPIAYRRKLIEKFTEITFKNNSHEN